MTMSASLDSSSGLGSRVVKGNTVPIGLRLPAAVHEQYEAWADIRLGPADADDGSPGEPPRAGSTDGRIVGADGSDPLEAAMAYLGEISQFGLPVIGLAREAVQRALDLPVTEGLKEEADLNTLSFQTADAIEGLTAFLEKRKPVFKDE